jgi:chromate transporter
MAPAMTAWTLFALWLRIGAQSFGGGVATQFLIHKTFVQQRGALSDDEFTRLFAICQIAPGINLFAFAILIGNKLAGFAGIGAALAGMLLPSVSITLLMTAAYAQFKDSPIMQAAVRGITPAVTALGVVMCWKLVRPILLGSAVRRRFPQAFAFLLMALCLILVAVFNLPTFAVYLIAGVLAALAAWRFGIQGSNPSKGFDP